MFQNKSASEWDAATETVKAQIASVNFDRTQRQLTRERRSLALEDRYDRKLEIQIQSEDTRVKTAETKLKGDQQQLATERSRLKFAGAKHKLLEQGWAMDLQAQSLELASSGERLRQLESVARELNHKIGQRVGANLFGGASDAT
jgi:hypothetical protein